VTPALSEDEETRLAAQHQAAMRFYIWAMTELAANKEPLSHQEFLRRSKLVDYARELYKTAKSEHERFRQKNQA